METQTILRYHFKNNLGQSINYAKHENQNIKSTFLLIRL